MKSTMMKSKLLLLLLLLPLALMAQSKKATVVKFYDKYSNYPSYSSMEVTEPMFKLFNQVEDADPKTVAFLKKLKQVRMLEFDPGPVTLTVGRSSGIATTSFEPIRPIINNSILYTRAMDELDLSSYTTLMKSNQNGEKMIFLRKRYAEYPGGIVDQEFLLITGNTLVQIRGDINISHLYQMDQILDAIGEILPQ